MTTYTYEHESYGRKETRIDVNAFAADLAKELGAQIALPHSDIPSLLINDDLWEMPIFVYPREADERTLQYYRENPKMLSRDEDK